MKICSVKEDIELWEILCLKRGGPEQDIPGCGAWA